MKYSKINWNKFIFILFSIENQIYQLVFKFYKRETENERETEKDRQGETETLRLLHVFVPSIKSFLNKDLKELFIEMNHIEIYTK